ncbi:MAG TPA: LacI family DNA-binding transcriptional regulator [Chthoniobacteraceae bacterium]|nr:LacI family DNA-binding transcriptional regulator [Chthoniobacteraceae bacterium]
MATQKDIAEYLNISQQAVSASLGNGRSNTKVSLETRQRVLEAARKLRYVPNHLARSLKSGRTSVIGVIMPYCWDPHYSLLIDALALEALRRNYSLMLQFHFWSREVEEAALRRLVEARVDGMLVHLGSRPEARMTAMLETVPVPAVSLQATSYDRLFHGVVEKDLEREGYLAAEALLRLGHRRIDLLAARPGLIHQRRRMKGMQLAIRRAGVEAQVQNINLTAEELEEVEPPAPASLAARNALGPKLAQRYFNTPHRGTAVLVGNETIAWEVMAEAARRGLSVPGDLSLISSGTAGSTTPGPVSSSALEYDPVAMAAAAFEILLDDRDHRRVIVPQWVSRQSTAAPPVPVMETRVCSGIEKDG